MGQNRVIKMKKAGDAYQNWASSPQGRDYLDAQENIAAPVNEPSEELAAALAVLNEGGLTHLTAIQQRVFQLSVVEGLSTREVAKELDIAQPTVVQHIEAIGRILRRLCEKKL